MKILGIGFGKDKGKGFIGQFLENRKEIKLKKLDIKQTKADAGLTLAEQGIDPKASVWQGVGNIFGTLGQTASSIFGKPFGGAQGQMNPMMLIILAFFGFLLIKKK